MDDLLPAVAHQNGGYIMRHQLNDIGFSDKAIRAAVAQKRLVRVRHGTYVPAALWTSLDDTGRHAVVVRSLLDKLGDVVVASHQSAASLHGLDLFDVAVHEVHLTRRDGLKGKSEAGVVFHAGRLDDDDVVLVDGCAATTIERTVMETCTTVSIESGIVLASSALRLGRVQGERLEELVEIHAAWPGMRRGRVAVRLSDARLESVGEARSFHMFWRYGVPAPDLQVEIRDERGRFVARTDFDWDDCCHVGEFDGKQKYGRLNPFTDDPGRQLSEEKVREDRIRATQRGVTRWIWGELFPDRAPATARRINTDRERSRKLYRRNRVTIPLS